MQVFDDPTKSRKLALGLGVLGGPLVAIGIAVESTIVTTIGVVVLAASGATWAIRGVKEDQIAASTET